MINDALKPEETFPDDDEWVEIKTEHGLFATTKGNLRRFAESEYPHDPITNTLFGLPYTVSK